ncbi:FUSC family protein [Roseateles violae]|uniref:Aromatic acid exporter family protein n=1 Tax=Roseateles violae TaxID=3058042 RepID=A0ABT8DNE4_9BURK|nr:FUSC family protein [Pelomonas sp. PFR6]MDN3919493.1 aromatic acid exporter family protein [Pelomonas sp. PFR6]
MPRRLGWKWPRDSALLYCAKVAAATLLGYLLAVGEAWYAVYAAFSAALIVGPSRGEDTGGAANRVRGSLAGMLIGVLFSHLGVPPALSVALSIGTVAYLCMGMSWGIPAVRVGASLAAVTVLTHRGDALDYLAMRALNTLIGIAAGLAVSYLLLPVGGQAALARSLERALAAVERLLTALVRSAPPPDEDDYLAVIEALADLEKVVRDADKEIGGDPGALRNTARMAALACAGALSAALAHRELLESMGPAQAALHCGRAAELARRAGGKAALPPSGEEPEPADQAALQAFALALRKIDEALRALGR